MSGQLVNMERGIPGSTIILDVMFRQYNSGPLVDDDDYSVDGTLPIVEIYDSSGVKVLDSSDTGVVQPVRVSTGDYTYSYAISSSAIVSNQWKILWKLTIDGNAVEFSEFFIVAEAGSAAFGTDEFRVGFAFGNPDLTSSHHASENVSLVVGEPDIRGFGLIVSPDTIRYVTGFGTKLVSPNANQSYSDDHLLFYVDSAIGLIERELDIDILPRVVRHEDPTDQTSVDIGGGSLAGEGQTIRMGSTRIARQDLPPESEEPNRIREEGYPYRPNNAKHYLYIKLRRRPLRDVMKAVMADPIQNTIIDLYSWRKESKGFESKLQFSPNLTAISNYPFMPSKLMVAAYPFKNYPQAIFLDYKTGYLNAADVPLDLRTLIYWISSYLFLIDFSDGVATGVASSSVNLNSISESLSTTMSASVDPNSTVRLREKVSGMIHDFKIGELYKAFKDGLIGLSNFEVQAVNPFDTKDVQYKQLLDVVEHVVPHKRFFKIYLSSGKWIGITEDHSLFLLETNQLIGVKGSLLGVKDQIVVVKNGQVMVDSIVRIQEYLPPEDKVYDLSIQDFENFIVNDYILAHNTNSFYGARIAYFKEEVKKLLKSSRHKYQRAVISIL